MRNAIVALPVILAAVTLTSCDRPADPPPPHDPSPAAGASTASDAYVRAAETIVAFLRGDTTLDAIAVADTVTLLVSPEGGSATVRIPRDSLRSPAAWRIRSPTRAEYALAPPAGFTQLTTAPGHHINCREGSLEPVAPQLAQLPHVGTKLEPPDAASCLASWNVTFVFSPAADAPTLVAAVYDQWEW